jgi:RecA/RadA recombinase
MMAKKEGTKGVFIKGSAISNPPRIPSGVFLLDLHLGLGSNGLCGWAIGRMNILYGNESGGKSTLVLKALGNAQKLCPECYKPREVCNCKKTRPWSILFVNSEDSWTVEWANAHGVNSDEVDIFHPSSIDNLIDVLTEEIPNRDIVVIETLASIISSEEVDDAESMTKSIGLKARKLDQAAQKWMSDMVSSGKRTTLFIENQLRTNIAVGNMPYLPQDELDTLPGGRWQRFYSTIMVKMYPSKPIIDKPDIEGVQDIKESKDVIAQQYTFEVKKNKVFIKGQKETFLLSTINIPDKDVKVGDVISNEEAIAQMALTLGLAAKIGDKKIEYGPERSFPYMSAFVKFLKENKNECEILKNKIIDLYHARHSTFTITKEEEVNGNKESD